MYILPTGFKPMFKFFLKSRNAKMVHNVQKIHETKISVYIPVLPFPAVSKANNRIL